MKTAQTPPAQAGCAGRMRMQEGKKPAQGLLRAFKK
jgi:hypothetical protein